MELMLVIRVLLRRWWLVVIPIAIVAVFVVRELLVNRPAGGGFTTMFRYSAAQDLSAIPGRDGDFQDVWLASELAVNALTAWVQTGSFKQEIALKLAANGVEIDPAALGIAADNQRSVGQVFLSWPDEAQLRLIAQMAISVLQTRSQDYFPQLGGQPAQVTLLDAPAISPAPPPIADRFGPLIRLGLGLLAGIGLAFLAEYLDPTVRQREELEKLGFPVIATIPRHRR